MDFLQGISAPASTSSSTNRTHADYFPQAANFYATYCGPYEVYLRPLRYIYLSQSYFYRHFFPHIYPIYALFERAIGTLTTDSPDLATLAFLALICLISLKLLDMLRRTVLYWTKVAFKLAFYALVVGAGIYVWQRGIEQSLKELGWVVGLFMGLEDEGERIGRSKAAARDRDARRIPRHRGPQGRTRGAGWR